jgi:hypothetical protein
MVNLKKLPACVLHKKLGKIMIGGLFFEFLLGFYGGVAVKSSLLLSLAEGGLSLE